ncbi:hypothetical protein F5Y15DRAFT_415531 [Xylariaceae sp. FL0016]|nr:hypothetical protein F5Y15DRAFT_415531 [Xylariaceae sp. FL0016]
MFGATDSNGKGHAYIILNVLRGLNIFVLLCVMVTSVLMMIFAKLPNGFQFFDDITHFFVFCIATLLIITEVGLGAKVQGFIIRAWPIFGPDRGLTWLGLTMFLLGCHLLGTLSRDTYTKKSVPQQVQQVIMASGILVIAIGVFNIIASLLFRNRQSNLRAREVRSTGASVRDVNYHDKYSNDGSSTPSLSLRQPSVRQPSVRQPSVRKQKGLTRVFRQTLGLKPKISAPISHDVEQGTLPEYYPPHDRSSPIMPEVQRPPTAIHPALRESVYSEASHLDRFGHDSSRFDHNNRI